MCNHVPAIFQHAVYWKPTGTFSQSEKCPFDRTPRFVPLFSFRRKKSCSFLMSHMSVRPQDEPAVCKNPVRTCVPSPHLSSEHTPRHPFTALQDGWAGDNAKPLQIHLCLMKRDASAHWAIQPWGKQDLGVWSPGVKESQCSFHYITDHMGVRLKTAVGWVTIVLHNRRDFKVIFYPDMFKGLFGAGYKVRRWLLSLYCK